MFKIQIHPYDPNWPGQFAREERRILEALRGLDAEVEHIGSTAIPGMAAKPIIDIMIGLKGKDFDAAIPLIQGLGYTYNQRYEVAIPGRRYFVRYLNPEGLPKLIRPDEPSPDRDAHPHTHHIHLVTRDSSFWGDHLLFRDFLRNHPRVRDEYLSLKLELAQHLWEDGADYAAAKTEFIEAVKRKAQHETFNTNHNV